MSEHPGPDCSDRSEILGLLTAYVFGLDHRDFTRVASVFTEAPRWRTSSTPTLRRESSSAA